MKTMNFPVWLDATVWKICPKCNDQHEGSCEHCAWGMANMPYGCNIGVGIWPDGSFTGKPLQVVEAKVTKRNIFTICKNFGTMYFDSKEAAEAAMQAYDNIRHILDKRERYDEFVKWYNANSVSITEYEPVKAALLSFDPVKGTAICSNCNRQDHIDPLATHCRYCGAEFINKNSSDSTDRNVVR